MIYDLFSENILSLMHIDLHFLSVMFNVFLAYVILPCITVDDMIPEIGRFCDLQLGS